MNLEVARALREIADFFAVKGDRFRSRAYRRAAQRIESLTEDIREVHARGELRSIPGVGESIARVVEELITTGRCRLLEELRESMPGGIHELMEIEGIGPKTALLLHRKLGITTLEELETAVREGRLRTLRGFGPKVEENILKAIEIHRSAQRRFLLGQVLTTIEALERYMAGSEAVERVIIAGSARRRKETVGDLDLLVASERHLEVVERFVSLPEVVKVVSRGTTKSTIILRSGLQVDLRVVDPESFGSALQYFTGSKEHNIKLRRIAVR
ncbi:DNA polymerase/3'-5' exonuclease PolX, partial [Candidatus Bathyarchaeota archaeon]|nr:DNA polymerase/3'-5' exonuclease PolX [Candidatus Bathyarchaeota archaeon]